MRNWCVVPILSITSIHKRNAPNRPSSECTSKPDTSHEARQSGRLDHSAACFQKHQLQTPQSLVKPGDNFSRTPCCRAIVGLSWWSAGSNNAQTRSEIRQPLPPEEVVSGGFTGCRPCKSSPGTKDKPAKFEELTILGHDPRIVHPMLPALS